MPIFAIAVMDEGRGIGKENQLLWDLPEDMKRFVALTKGCDVFMGRKTFESLKRKPLPNRKNVVVTRDPSLLASFPTVQTVESFVPLLEQYKGGDRVLWILGGGEIYRQTLPYWDRVYLTLVPGKRDADTFFPRFEEEFAVSEEEKGESCTFFTFVRK